MDFKKATLVTALIISQAATAVPASAEAVSSPQVQSQTATGVPSLSSASPVTFETNGTTNTVSPDSSLDGAKQVAAVNSDTQTAENAAPSSSQSTQQDQAPNSPANSTTPADSQSSQGSVPADGTGNTGPGDNASGNGSQPQDGGTLTIPDPASTPATLAPVAPGRGQLILYMNSSRMEQDGRVYTATHAMTVKKGVSYVGIRSLVDRVGYQIAYDAKTKETIITYAGNELRFKTGSSSYRVNGVSKTMRGASYQDKNVFMVPLTAITQALNIPYSVSGKKVIVQLSTKPVATFTVQSGEIFAGQTILNFVTKSYSPKGLQIVNERWTGRPDQDMFQSAGTYPVTYSVQDSSGEWSAPFTVNIKVVNPNVPPVAQFVTNKAEYKMGELVTVTDQSTDEEGAITDRKWANKQLAYFTPGPQMISLTVKDKHGAESTIEKTINITNESLYTEDQFYKLFTPIGQNLQINGAGVLNYNKIPFTYTTEPYTLFRDSGPESVTSEGILYQDTITGLTRFMIHHRNRLGGKAKVYLIAKNMDSQNAKIDYLSYGTAGPNQHPELTGRLSVQRYFENYQSGVKEKTVTLAPGETRVIFEDLNALALNQEDVISLFGDLYSDSQVQYTVLIVKADNDPIKALSTLPALDPRESIIRGTFSDSTRVFDYSELIGNTNMRLHLTDNTADPFQTGTDGIMGTPATNSGNYGVLYKIKLHRVAPNTLITFNPRGGLYMGAALVNGNVVSFSHSGSVNVPNQTSVLYRTKDYEENVEIWISPSAGSNMPFALLFMPMPQVKQQ
ncbi:stalk domain-containing protein [Paenibacillus sp. YPG26]|uniref:stalk domain-containing protein n=1 Tax=Paenibacillus sp. YPG26 TaxID=2878915 RepID=UPI002040CEF3|nr:stalk domain-containing protein [Paenibacillus sp. YPG26]USB33001.1 copper amine oxidase N-terminal domain-containing protein [Paenibacillus sp. YPG26]